MELTSSKVRLASSVSSVNSIFKTSRFRKRHIAVVVIFVMVAVGGGFLLGYFVKGNSGAKCTSNGNETANGYPQNKDDVIEVFGKFEREVSAEKLKENLRFFSERIHLAGLERSRELAEYLAKEWREYQFDEVETPKYKVLLSYPVENKPNMISMVDSNGTIMKNITEQLKVSSGPGSKNRSLFTPYTAYSMNGTAGGKLIYINEGTKNDFDELEKLNISINGTIVLSRSFNHFYKASLLAAAKGAKGLLYYPDPEKYAREGLGKNSTYPNSPWLSSDAVLLAGVYGGLGDPLTPYLPSLDGIRRIPIKDVTKNLPPILIQPISYGTARVLLEQVNGDEMPSEWLRDLKSTFQISQDYNKNNWTIRLSINNHLAEKTIYNVIGTIIGREEPDRYVFLGNHRDAWVYGAADALTGLSVLKETSRVLSKLVKQGWRPRRTIKLCSFGAEEFGLIGSVEWMEENYLIFKERGVAYLNTDVPVQGTHTLLAQTGPLLTDLIYKWTKQVKVPVNQTYESMFDVMLRRGPAPSSPGQPKLHHFQFASDYIPFYFKGGIPSADFSYFYNYTQSGWELYPSYHSQEDTFYWIQKFADPNFEIHRAMTLLMGGLLIDVADSLIIPFNATRLKDSLHKAYYTLTSSSPPLINASLVQQSMSALKRSLLEFSRRCDSFESAVTETNGSENVDLLKVRMLNNQLNMLGKAFINPRVKSRNPTVFQHVAFWDTFPGVKTVRNGDMSEIQEQLSIVYVAISSAAKILKPMDIPSQKEQK